MSAILLLLFFIEIGFPGTNSLRITYERADFSDVDPKILAEAFAECYPYNRTIRALHIRFKLKVNLDNDSTAIGRYSNFRSNEYRSFPIHIQLKIKDALKYKVFDMQDVYLNYSKPPLIWPVMKMQTYEVKDYVPNSQNFPNIPPGNYKIQILFMHKNKLFSSLNIYMKFEI